MLALRKSNADISSIKEKFRWYQERFGGGDTDIFIDQAIRVAEHWVYNCGCEDEITKEFVEDCFHGALDVEDVVFNAKIRLKTKELDERYALLSEMLSELRVLIK